MYKISKWYLSKPVIFRSDFSVSWFLSKSGILNNNPPKSNAQLSDLIGYLRNIAINSEKSLRAKIKKTLQDKSPLRIIITSPGAWKSFIARFHKFMEANKEGLLSLSLKGYEDKLEDEQVFSDYINDLIVNRNIKVIKSPPIEVKELDDIISDLREEFGENNLKSSWIMGLGGGRVMDTSKYISLKLKSHLCLIPSILSTTSWLNMGIALRENNILKSAGNKHANTTIVDPELIISAPRELTLGGLIDLLAANSAAADWKLAHQDKNERISLPAIEDIKKSMSLIFSSKELLLNFDITAIQFIYEQFLNFLSICGGSGSGRPVEGSEHLLYYYIDEIKKDIFFNHGRIIGLTSILCSYLHGKRALFDAQTLIEFYKELGIKYAPRDLKLTEDDIIEASIRMPEFVLKRNHFYSIWNTIDKESVKARLLEVLEKIKK
ncbi:MAG: iron-containing alcohol dehydrogenase [Promethearchaeota archaeon]